MTEGALRAGKGISDRFRKALPFLPESNATTLAALIDVSTGASDMLEALRNIVANAKLIPDPAMHGATDIYAVPLDDIEAAIAAIAKAEGK